MIKQCIIFIFFIALCTACKGNKEINLSDSIVFKIDFQNDFVKSDKITLLINGCIVFENKAFQSDSIIGFTRKEVIAKGVGSHLLLLFEDDTISCKINTFKLIIIEIKLNGESKIYELNFTKGKYIGISNSKKGIIIAQQDKEFIYD